MLVSSKVWFIDHYVSFLLNTKTTYQNIIIFLKENNLTFLATLNFGTIPATLHGKGQSNNLLEYLSNNYGDVKLIKIFLIYFLDKIVKISYSTGQKINFIFGNETRWQNLSMWVLPYSMTTTT
jgi:hypothetical protein